MSSLDLIGLLAQDAFWSAVAAVGFAILFNVPRRTLAWCAVCGAVGHAGRTLLIQAGVEFELATLFGAAMIGWLGILAARQSHAPVTIFGISAAVTLVPGVFAYQTMLAILEMTTANPATANEAVASAAINAVKTGLTLGAIAAGIAAPSLLFLRRKPVV